MKLGVLTVLYQDLPVETTLDKLAELGVEAVEFGTGNYPGNAHCDPDELLADASKARALKRAVADRGMIISALSCHGNPLHPNEDVARRAHEVWRKTARLAAELGVSVGQRLLGLPRRPRRSQAP
ncbi:hypothetical protein BH20ACT23_BH20ACT23_05350 [soil metagenome]